jgi:hypothetical protein
VHTLFAGHGEDRNNVRMAKRRRRMRFLPKSREPRTVERRSMRQDFDGHTPSQRDLLRLVDDAHAALADRTHKAKVAEGLGDELDGRLLVENWKRLSGVHAHGRSRVSQQVQRRSRGGGAWRQIRNPLLPLGSLL